MNFEEWKEENFFTDKHRSTDWDNPDLVAAWNAALDEAVKVVKDSPYRVLTQGQIEMAIKELKE